MSGEPNGVRVALSNGNAFYVQATLDEVRGVVGPAAYARGLVKIGERWVNGAQVVELRPGPIPTSLGEIPEQLEVPDGAPVV